MSSSSSAIPIPHFFKCNLLLNFLLQNLPYYFYKTILHQKVSTNTSSSFLMTKPSSGFVCSSSLDGTQSPESTQRFMCSRASLSGSVRIASCNLLMSWLSKHSFIIWKQNYFDSKKIWNTLWWSEEKWIKTFN